MWPGSSCAVVAVVLGVVSLCDEATARAWQDDCVFRPNADNPTSADCEFKSRETQIRLNTQSSIKSLRITRGRYVSLARGVFANFAHLQSIYITGVESLAFRYNSRLLIKEQNAVSLIVDLQHTGLLALDSGAFSDWQHPGTKIVLKNIKQLTFSKQALASNSTFKSLVIENVPAMVMKKESVQANIGHLSLKNVSLAVCLSNTFSGNMQRMSLISVNSHNVEMGCITAGKPGWKSFSVRSSNLTNVATSAIQGTIEDVQIEDCTLGDVKRGGLDLDVSRFSLSSCEIGILREGALQVRANNSISLHSLQVGNLHNSALLGLRIDRSDGYRRLDDQQPQICLSALTVHNVLSRLRDAPRLDPDALHLDPDSPVSLFGRVCPVAGQTRGLKRCIGVNSKVQVSRKVFQSRCCFDGISSRSPVCPAYGWIPYVAAGVGVVGVLLIAVLALFCYRRKMRAKRWHVARRTGHPRVSIAPSVEGLGSDTSGHSSPDCVFQCGNNGGKSAAEDAEDVFDEPEEGDCAVDRGPLASWLNTLRDTMPRYPGRGSAETIEMMESGASEGRGVPGETVLPGGACTDHENLPVGTDAGSDTESVLHGGGELAESKKSDEGKQRASFDSQPPEEHKQTEAGVPDMNNAASCQWNQDDCAQNRSKKKKKKPDPVRPSGSSTAESIQQPQPEQPMPLYSEVKKRKRPPKSVQQSNQVSSSAEALKDSTTSSRDLSSNDGDAIRNGGTVAFGGKFSTFGQRQPDVVYADVFNSLPRVPTVDPAARHRRRSSADSDLYDDVYHSLNKDKTRDRGPGASSQRSDEDDETYDDVLGVARNGHSDTRKLPGISSHEELPLMSCPVYGKGHEGPHAIRGAPGAAAVRPTSSSADSCLYAEVNDEGPVTNSCRTVPRERSRDRRGGGSGIAARTSYLYAEICDFAPTAEQGNDLQETEASDSKYREVHSYAAANKNTRNPKSKDDVKSGGLFSKSGGLFSLPKPLPRKSSTDKSGSGGRRWLKK